MFNVSMSNIRLISPKLINARGFMLGLLWALVSSPAWMMGHATAATVSDPSSASDFVLLPPLGTAGATPLVMINLSRDHQLFYKAYNDYSDLDNDGQLETTYINDIDYYGYFDSHKCYNYSSSGYFEPQSTTSSKYCSGNWSGNFLNWVSMSRIDAVRKILYGGKRSTDSTTKTVLERAFLPTDAHAWAKYYNGSDIASLTPFNPATTAPTGTAGQLASSDVADLGENSRTYVRADFTISGISNIQVGDQLKIISTDGAHPGTILAGVRSIISGPKIRVRIQDGQVGPPLADPNRTTLKNNLRQVNGWSVTDLTRTGISFCNLTEGGSGNGRYSQYNTNPPLIRAVKGNYGLWGANEKKQCLWSSEANNAQSGFQDGFLSNGNRGAFSGIGASAENPDQASVGLGSGDGTGQYIARVHVCVDGLIGNEKCEQYPDGDYKPIGLLQQYGESGRLKFGLVTPSFQKNVSGGVLRKALPGPGVNDTDSLADEIDAQNGLFLSPSNGTGSLIGSIDKLRIYGYDYNQADNYASNGCPYQQTGIVSTGAGGTLVSEGNCASWGNPMAESYVETLRYLGGYSPNGTFDPGSNSHDATLGLTVVSDWDDNDPLSAANYCAALNVINFNASVVSYDNDQLDKFSPDINIASAKTWTDMIGQQAGIDGNNWFVGSAGSSSDDLCSAKTVGNFGEISGICPEAPALKGGYNIAGAAYGAHVDRIRSDLDASDEEHGVVTSDHTSLKVDTYGVQLATNTPQIRVPVPGTSGAGAQYVSILPAYRLDLSSNGSGPFGGGELVDFKIISQDWTDPNRHTGSFYVNWEDSFAGGDYDQDVWGIISYEVTDSTVKVTTDVVASSTSNGQGFGYIVSGTDKDGPHFHSGILNFDYDDSTQPQVHDAVTGLVLNGSGHINNSGGCSNCVNDDGPTYVVYNLSSSSSAGTLEDPLWYAAKWGGFNYDHDQSGTPAPDNVEQWDQHKADGSIGQDGVPDNYFLVSNPAQLERSLNQVFSAIVSRVSSGTAAAVVATSSQGIGLTYQALYEAEYKNPVSNNKVTWIGNLNALWTDSAGLLREDGNQNGKLDDYDTDKVVTFYFDAGARHTKFSLHRSLDPNNFIDDGNPILDNDLKSLKTVWSANKQLWNPSLNTATQRSYSSPSSSGRYIFTWVDANNDHVVDSSEVLPLEWGSNGINASNMGFVNSDNTAEAQNIVDWARGTEVSGLRSRTVDYNGDGNSEVMRLGDIVDSTPLSIGTPAENYDYLYNDQSYADFFKQYRGRRQMIYAGANDGMLHAFNGGFYNALEQQLQTTPIDGTSATAHPLGGEVWAYVPGDLLAQVRWLTEPDYAHSFYVDGSPIAFDAKVFTDDATHPHGWGTVLVVPFRLGGGAITVDTANDGLGAANTDNDTADDETFDSAYVVMDVTDPESAPKVLAEITSDSRTTSEPAALFVRDAATGTPNRYFLAIGSGPTDPLRVATDKPLKVRVYDVSDLVSGSITPAKTFDLSGGGNTPLAENSFAGDLVASDFDLDGLSEAIYFGSIKDTGSDEFTGAFWKIAVNGDSDPSTWMPKLMLDTGKPVSIRPTLGRNNRGAPMVFFGTGRLFSKNDQATSDQQRIYGIIDPSLLPSGDAQFQALPLSTSDLVDVTNIDVKTDKSVSGGPSGVNTFQQLFEHFDEAGSLGWYRDLFIDGGNPSERVVSRQSLLGGILLTSTYKPGTSICTGLGTSNLFGVNYKTGTGDPTATFFGDTGGSPGNPGTINVSTELGKGLPAPPSLHVGEGSGSRKVTACVQTSTGAILCKDITTLNSVLSGEVSWREPVDQ